MAIKRVKYGTKSFDIGYDIVNPKMEKSIIFLHGWGSNRTIMQMGFEKNLKKFRHIYIDLMGFGKSSNEYILDSFEYAKVIDIFLKQIDVSKDIVVGHSFGGKVASLLNPKLLVLLSSAGILEEKSLKVKFKIALFKLLKPLGINSLRNLFVANDGKNLSSSMYETFKRVIKEDFREIFRNYSGEALIFWGSEDSATSLESGKTISSLIKRSYFYEYKGEHYFFLEHFESISERIEEFGRV